MTRFRREGHFRSGRYGDIHWVEAHWVERTDWDRASYGGAPAIARPYRPRLTFESFTRPTTCSYCGAEVYFYQSPYGGKVFFDRLGRPWPKHILTCPAAINEARESIVSVVSLVSPAGAALAYIPELPWDDEEWTLVRIERIFREDSWYVLKFRTLADEMLVRALVADDPGDLARLPASLSPWSVEGFAVLSYLDDHGDAHELTVCRYADFCLSDPDKLQVPDVLTKTRS
jgi:hypothetical protein